MLFVYSDFKGDRAFCRKGDRPFEPQIVHRRDARATMEMNAGKGSRTF